jgi:hypothetical protein
MNTRLPDKALVLEVGSGSNPWPRSDVLVDRYYIDETGQRGGTEIFRDQRPMIVAAGERLPFKDKAFDFAYTCHVVEHAEDIAGMLNEMSRVAKAGFIECPNPLLERILDQDQHNWYITKHEGKLFVARKDAGTNVSNREDRFYFHMMSDHFIVRQHWERFVTRLHWKDRIDFEICESVERVFALQHIDSELPNQVQVALLGNLAKAWLHAVKSRFMETASRMPGNGILRTIVRAVRRNRRNQVAPRVDEAILTSLLACPHCRGQLLRHQGRFDCSSCERRYTDADGVMILL